MPDVSSFLDDKFFAQLRQDFLVDARERLDTIETAATEIDDADNPVLIRIGREAHSLKGIAGSLGFPSITLIAHYLEDYLAELRTLGDRHATNVLQFVDCMRRIVESGADPGDARTSELLRTLPAHAARDIVANEATLVEVLLVTPSRVVGHKLTGELRSLGFRVHTVRSPWEALETTARTRPDLVITSAIMDGVNGIDLARAFRAISATEDINIALATTLSRDSAEMARLPENVAIVRLGPALSDDLADAVLRFDLG